MKRFYCTICKKVKHVRVLPQGVDIHQERTKDRTGECRFHNSNESRAVVHKRVRIVAGIGSTRKTKASSAKTKSKRG